jgi:glycosyltransferase involved in cell wall biosynthesis
MRICHISAHLPPDQAANALLPFHLGTWARQAGDEVIYLAHRPRAQGSSSLPGRAIWITTPRDWHPAARSTRVATLAAATQLVVFGTGAMRRADLVHVHSNGLLPELGVLLARRLGKPVVWTMYGTEIWHYEPRRRAFDLFSRAFRAASVVTFYSQALASRAQDLGLARRRTTVIYPPVTDAFEWRDAEGQFAERQRLDFRNRHLLINVKRLHPLAGQRFLIRAMNEIIRTHPDTRLLICGTGPLEHELRMLARTEGVEGHITFTGLVDNRLVARYCMAADVFVLPSLVEACPTVALEALACGTPVIAADSPGGLELNDLFGPDVYVVPREQPLALAKAIIESLEHKRRARAATGAVIEREFRPAAIREQYRAAYRQAINALPTAGEGDSHEPPGPGEP